MTHVEWLTAHDEHVCPLCAERDGRILTLTEAKQMIEGDLCRPQNPYANWCRCVILPCRE